MGWILPGRIVAVLAGALALGACAVPAQYLGLSTAEPIAPEDQLRIDAALAGAPGPGLDCPWTGGGETRGRVPCTLLPAGRLAGLAWQGNKAASLELGIRFEEGRGVPQDRDKARELYRAAAQRTGGLMWVYSPGIMGHPGQLIPVDQPVDPGLPEAQARLLALNGAPILPGGVKLRLGVPVSDDRARVEVPGGVAEDGKRDDEPQERRQQGEDE